MDLIGACARSACIRFLFGVIMGRMLCVVHMDFIQERVI